MDNSYPQVFYYIVCSYFFTTYFCENRNKTQLQRGSLRRFAAVRFNHASNPIIFFLFYKSIIFRDSSDKQIDRAGFRDNSLHSSV